MKLKALALSIVEIFLSLGLLRVLDNFNLFQKQELSFYGPSVEFTVYPIVFIVGWIGLIFALDRPSRNQQIAYSLIVFLVITFLLFKGFYEPNSYRYY